MLFADQVCSEVSQTNTIQEIGTKWHSGAAGIAGIWGIWFNPKLRSEPMGLLWVLQFLYDSPKTCQYLEWICQIDPSCKCVSVSYDGLVSHLLTSVSRKSFRSSSPNEDEAGTFMNEYSFGWAREKRPLK